MTKLIRSLACADGTEFEEIQSFETETFYGIWINNTAAFGLIPNEDDYFDITILDEVHSFDELEDEVFKTCGEHVIGVSISSKFKLTMIE